jgi:hypothetical protein
MDLSMYLLAVMTHIVTLTLDEVLELVVPHMAIKDLLNLILLVTINDSGWWWRVMLTIWDRVSVRGHLSVSLLPLSSPTLHLFICIPPPHLCTIFKDHT